ncbi:MAG: ABC transporter permease, partial [bacterium]
RTQYVDSLLGVLWSMLKPLALIGLYALVFSKVITPTVTVDGAPINFGLFLFAGMLPWTAVQESSQRSCTVFTDQSSLVRHHTVPLSMYPLAIVLSSTLSTLVIVLVFILVKVTVSGSFPALSLLLLPVIPVQVLFCFGISLTVSILNVFIRDISHLTTTVLTVLFFTSPIIFPPGSLPVPVLKLMWLNPLTGYVFLYRDLLLLDRLPSAPTMISVVLVTAASIAAGAALYRRSHRRIVDWA